MVLVFWKFLCFLLCDSRVPIVISLQNLWPLCHDILTLLTLLLLSNISLLRLDNFLSRVTVFGGNSLSIACGHQYINWNLHCQGWDTHCQNYIISTSKKTNITWIDSVNFYTSLLATKPINQFHTCRAPRVTSYRKKNNYQKQ